MGYAVTLTGAVTAGFGQQITAAPFDVAVFGDSVTMGYYAIEPFYENSFVAQANAAIAAETGIPNGGGMLPVVEGADATTGDDRFTFGGTWITQTAASGYYNQIRRGSTGSTMSFTSECDAFRLHYLTADSTISDPFTLTVDDGAPVTVDPVIGVGMFGSDLVTVQAGAYGAHTLTMTASATASRFVFLIGVEALRNASRAVKVSRIARSSMKVSQFIASAFGSSSLPCATTLAPDLAILAFGLNDALEGVTTTAFKAGNVTAIDAFRAVGSDVALMVPPPPNPGLISAPTWANYVTAINELAVDESCEIIDITDRWVSYATSSSLYFDNVHPNTAGHADIGDALAAFVLSLAP